MIGLGPSGVKAGRQAQPTTATSWAAQAESQPSPFPWKKDVCVQGTEWVGREERGRDCLPVFSLAARVHGQREWEALYFAIFLCFLVN